MKKIYYSWRKYCCEPLYNIEGYDRFINDNNDEIWDCHHRLEIELGKTSQELKDENLYYGRPASELVIMTHSEHMSLHSNNRSEETRQKMSDTNRIAHTGKTLSDEHRMKIAESLKGRTLSDETRYKMSEAAKNMSDETRRKLSEAKKGKQLSEEHRRKIGTAKKETKWWTNGVINKRSKECPGPDFVPGQLRHK